MLEFQNICFSLCSNWIINSTCETTLVSIDANRIFSFAKSSQVVLILKSSLGGWNLGNRFLGETRKSFLKNKTIEKLEKDCASSEGQKCSPYFIFCFGMFQYSCDLKWLWSYLNKRCCIRLLLLSCLQGLFW